MRRSGWGIEFTITSYGNEYATTDMARTKTRSAIKYGAEIWKNIHMKTDSETGESPVMRNRKIIERSQMAGCYFCMNIFPVAEIVDWACDGYKNNDIDALMESGDGEDNPDVETTALCPKCGIDSVIGDDSKFPIQDEDFLKDMNHWGFGGIHHSDGETVTYVNLSDVDFSPGSMGRRLLRDA